MKQKQRHVEFLLETGNFSPEQMIKVIELSENNPEVALTVVEAGKSKLSPEQMVKIVELSGGDPDVAKAVVKTGKLSRRQMLDVIKLTTFYDQGVAQAVVEQIDWDKLSPKQMIEALELSGNNPEIALAAVKTGRLSVKQMIKTLELSGGNWIIANEVLQRCKSSLSREQVAEILYLARNNPYVEMTAKDLGLL